MYKQTVDSWPTKNLDDYNSRTEYSQLVTIVYGKEKGLGELIEELNFQLATFDCNKQIETIRKCVIENRQKIELFCMINNTSTCFHNYFAIIGNFVGTEIITSRQDNQSITKLYPANILFKKNENDSLTLFSTFPEDRDHDFFIKDFISRLKEILK